MKKITIFLVLLASSLKALACSCVSESDDFNSQVLGAYENATSVVLAKVQSIDKLEPYEYKSEVDANPIVEHSIHRTHFSEIRSWKGEHGKQFYTYIMVMCCVCGYEFEVGKTYLLYLHGPDSEGSYSTSSCSRTKQYSEEVEAEIEVLNGLQ